MIENLKKYYYNTTSYVVNIVAELNIALAIWIDTIGHSA